MGTVDLKCIILIVYSSICVALSLSFFVTWIQSDAFGRGDVTPWSEWMGLLFTVLGFLSQSAHGAVIYMQIKNFDGYEPLRQSPTRQEGVVDHAGGTGGHAGVRMHL